MGGWSNETNTVKSFPFSLLKPFSSALNTYPVSVLTTGFLFKHNGLHEVTWTSDELA